MGCEKSIKTLFGQVDDLLTIAPGESISLCFVRDGVLEYNVWFDACNPKGSDQSDGDRASGEVELTCRSGGITITARRSREG